MEVDYNGLGKRLQRIRKQNNLTQEALAEMIDKTPNFIGAIENGKSKAAIQTVVDLCNALHITPNHLLMDSVETACPEQAVEMFDLLSHLNLTNRKMVDHLIRYLLNQEQ